MQFKRAKKTGN